MADTTLGKYTLEKLVATGGMAEIWLARDPQGRAVAIKRILPHLARDERFTTMFLDEAALASKLLHPNIARIHELGRDGDEYFLAMEFIDGADLADVLDAAEASRTLIPIAAAAFITCEVLDALHFAHTFKDHGKPLNIVHRDVSPHNVLISTDGRVKLVDFGVAKAVERHSKTQTGVVKGKLSYMAPEQIRQDDVDARADLFAVGVLFYELLTNTTPFGRDLTAISAILHDPAPDPRTLRATIPEAVAAIVLKSLEKDPATRYQTSGEMRNVLRLWLGQQPDVTTSHIARLTREFNANTRPPLPPDIDLPNTTMDMLPVVQTPMEPARVVAEPVVSLALPSHRDEHVRTAVPVLGVLLLCVIALAAYVSLNSSTERAPQGFVFYEESDEWDVSDEELQKVASVRTHYMSSDLLVEPWVERLQIVPAQLDPGSPDILDYLQIAPTTSKTPKQVKKARKKKKKVIRPKTSRRPVRQVQPDPPRPQERPRTPTTLEHVDKVVPSF